MRLVAATLAVCLLLSIGGCTALPGGNGDGGGPPGVADGRLADAEALADAHATAMTERGYSHEIALNQTRTVDGEPTETFRGQRTSVAPGASEYRYQLVNRGEASSRFTVWGNESVQYRRIEAGGQQQFTRGEPASTRTLTGIRLLEPHLTAPYEVVETRETDGGTLTVLEATDRPTADAAFPDAAENVRRYEARLVVDQDGRIRSFEATAAYDLEGEPADYRLSFEVTHLGDPGVTRPGWVDEEA